MLGLGLEYPPSEGLIVNVPEEPKQKIFGIFSGPLVSISMITYYEAMFEVLINLLSDLWI
ncbi:MAG: hypothetical protein QGF78_03560 [Candidatus Bathyarchaeota archaeon]|jgi:hypothetical protein|nr:hypothetical protein [Candidatus Bathyarchaeota archaeon]